MHFFFALTMQDAVLLFSSAIFPIGLVLDTAKSCSGFLGGNSGWVTSDFRGIRWQHICPISKHRCGIFEFQFLALTRFSSLSSQMYKKNSFGWYDYVPYWSPLLKGLSNFNQWLIYSMGWNIFTWAFDFCINLSSYVYICVYICSLFFSWIK